MSSLDDLVADPRFPFAGEISVKPLDDRVVPELVRHGVAEGLCHSCQRPDDDHLWSDERWRLSSYLPTPVRGIVLLETRGHHDSFADMPADLLGELGSTVARVERALLGLGDVARVHVNRWADASAHFHLWFMPRPLGMLQLRGSMLPLWLDLLPALGDEVATAALRQVAQALAADGGVSHV